MTHNQQVAHKAILGTWQSDATLTLESMNSVEGVTVKARELLENDFFGHLIVDYREDEWRSINEKDGYDSGFVPYEVLEVTGEYIRIGQWNTIFGEFEERTLYLQEDCFYVVTSKFEFREYFIRYG